jgi:hypothetical protein
VLDSEQRAFKALFFLMTPNKALSQRLKTLQRRITMIEALMDFLKHHPDIAPVHD